MSDEPLFWIHLNVDYPFNLTGILYFPKYPVRWICSATKIQLYCNQVFVTDEVGHCTGLPRASARCDRQSPIFLSTCLALTYKAMLGSRRYLTSRKKWPIGWRNSSRKTAQPMKRNGIVSRSSSPTECLPMRKFYERALKLYLFTDADGKFYTYDEYTELVRSEQTDLKTIDW